MNKVVVEYTRSFGSEKEADTFCESLDAAGQDWYNCKASPGEHTVYVGHVEQITAEEATAEHRAVWVRLDAARTRDEDQQKAKDRNVCVAIIDDDDGDAGFSEMTMDASANEDEIDLGIARARLRDIANQPELAISGEDLSLRLQDLLK